MDLKLVRKEYRVDGIFSELSGSGGLVAVTLEHAYLMGGDGPSEGFTYIPKIPNGIYTCVRGPHRLNGMDSDFETFEVMEVPNCTGILFHWGNFNKDSEGCILVGQAEVALADGSHMVTASRAEFAEFMKLQEGIDQFQLTVE